jgi:hypothetical protein
MLAADEENRQSVVFAARFELYTQRFRNAKTREAIDRLVPIGELIPDDWEPIENPARVREYWADVLPPGTPQRDYPEHWCGALCLFSIHRAGLGLEVFWRGGFASRELKPVALPQPGDVAYFHRAQHHAIVESVDLAEHVFTSFEGNLVRGFGRRGRPRASAAGFYSIEPLLRKAA